MKLPKGWKKLEPGVVAQLVLRPATEAKIFGHSVQGILYELSDQDYENPEAEIRVEIDPHDGTRWVCTLPRSLAPNDLQSYWRSSVYVEGEAIIHARKPRMKVSRFVPIERTEPLAAMRKLADSSVGLMDETNLEEFMNHVRERD